MKPWFIVAAVAVLAGCGAPRHAATGGGEEVQIAVTDRGFEPAVAVAKRGQAVTLVVTRKTDQTCATELVIAGLDLHRTLPLNQAVRIELPAARADTLSYKCGMDMLGGEVVSE
jgi:plastocyanin domain-containing protein